jgi:protein MpaA
VTTDHEPGVSRPSYAALTQAFRGLRRSIGLQVREVPCSESERTLWLGALGDSSAPSVALSAGVHGDEPAGPWAVLSVLESGLLDPRFAYHVWPCTNPSGYILGTRCNAEGRDINRSFSGGGSTPEARAVLATNGSRRFALSIDVHEDHEAQGFYCYVAGPQADALGGAITRAIVEEGFPLQDLAGFNFGEPGELNPHRRCFDGIVVMDGAEHQYFDGLSLNLRMIRSSAADRVVTLEAPRELPWEERIAIHRIAVVAALDHLATALWGTANGR